MTVRFPDEPAFAGRFAPMRLEGEIHDARQVDGEPAATVKLPIRLPGGLHGNWVTPEQLKEAV